MFCERVQQSTIAPENKSMFFYYLENKSFQLKHTVYSTHQTHGTKIVLFSLVIRTKLGG